MKLLLGTITYLSVVSAIVAATIAVLLELKPRPATTAVAARSAEPLQERPPPQQDAQPEPQRLPVWIAPTTKYDYVPPPPRHRGAKNRQAESRKTGKAESKKRSRTKPRSKDDGRRAIEARLGNTDASASGPALGFQRSGRDNDPFYRD